MSRRMLEGKLNLPAFDHLTQQLRMMGSKVERKVMRKSLKAGAGVILRAAKALAPVGRTKNLKKSMAISRGVRIRKYPHGTMMAVLGPGWPLGAHGPIVEEGTKMRRTRSGASRGRMPAMPFLAPAVAAQTAAATARVRSEVAKGIEKEIERKIARTAI